MGARLSASVQTGPGAHPASCTKGTGFFLGVKSGRGVTLTPHPLLVPWSRNSRAIPLLPLWAVWPVQSLGVCARVHFTFLLLPIIYMGTPLPSLASSYFEFHSNFLNYQVFESSSKTLTDEPFSTSASFFGFHKHCHGFVRCVRFLALIQEM